MKTDVLMLAHSPGNPRNSEGAFIQLANQQLIFIYSRYSGDSCHDHASCDLAMRCSSDGGKSWSQDDVIVFDHIAVNAQNLMSVSLLRLRSGRIILSCCRKTAADSEVDCIPVTAFSDDEAQSWSPLRPICEPPAYYVLCNDRLLELSDGTIIMPLATQKNELMYWASYDHGASWQQISDIIQPPADSKPCSIYQEPGVTELNDGRLWSWIRTDAGQQYGSWSHDQGKSWSRPVPMEDFYSPMAPMSVKRNPRNKKLFAVWDDHADRWDVPPPVYTRPGWGEVPTGGRFPLVIAESSDEGRTWHNIRRLEKDTTRGFCYTAMYFTNEALLLAYCCGGPDNTIMLQDMKIVYIPMDQVGDLLFNGV